MPLVQFMKDIVGSSLRSPPPFEENAPTGVRTIRRDNRVTNHTKPYYELAEGPCSARGFAGQPDRFQPSCLLQTEGFSSAVLERWQAEALGAVPMNTCLY